MVTGAGTKEIMVTEGCAARREDSKNLCQRSRSMHYFSAMCDESTVVLAAESDRDAVVFPTNITFFTVPVNEPPPLTFYRLPSGIDELLILVNCQVWFHNDYTEERCSSL